MSETKLSPAAQAVWDAYEKADCDPYFIDPRRAELAAALRAAAELYSIVDLRIQLFAIAAEFESHQPRKRRSSPPREEQTTECEVTELVAWLLEGGEDAAANGWDHQARRFGRAAELLQRLKPAPPTKAELKQLFDDHSGYINDEQVMWWSDFHVAARAVVARWGSY